VRTRNSGQLPPHIGAAVAQESVDYHNLWRRLLADAQRSGALRPGMEIGCARMLAIGALNWAAEWYRDDVHCIDVVIHTAQTMIANALLNEPC
jgi:hypothetical protein